MKKSGVENTWIYAEKGNILDPNCLIFWKTLNLKKMGSQQIFLKSYPECKELYIQTELRIGQ